MKKEQSRPATKEDLKSFFCNTKQELLKEYDDFLEKITYSDEYDEFFAGERKIAVINAMRKLHKLVSSAFLPTPLDEYWYYETFICANAIVLNLNYILEATFKNKELDELTIESSYELIRIPIPNVTVEQYARMREYQKEEIEDLIDRGLLHAAEKVNGEWKIPILAPIGDEEYDGQELFKWETYLENLPEEFGFLNGYNSVLISPDYRNPGYYRATFFGENNMDKHFDREEKRQFLLFLMSHPSIYIEGEGVLQITG